MEREPITDVKLVIGAGEYNNNPGWMHTQENELNLLKRSQWEERFAEESISAIVAEHVWEHLDYEEGVAAASCCFAYLKPGGYVRCAVPDGYFPDETYQRTVQIGGPGPADHPAASHKIVYDYKTITAMLESAGFKVTLLEFCDEQWRVSQQRLGCKGRLYLSVRTVRPSERGWQTKRSIAHCRRREAGNSRLY